MTALNMHFKLAEKEVQLLSIASSKLSSMNCESWWSQADWLKSSDVSVCGISTTASIEASEPHSDLLCSVSSDRLQDISSSGSDGQQGSEKEQAKTKKQHSAT